jgi:uracil-DNA glycosylase
MEHGTLDFDSALAALAWQVELGADEAICEMPVNRYDAGVQAAARVAAAQVPAPRGLPAVPPPRLAAPDAAAELAICVAEAQAAAALADDLAGLRAALDAYPHCVLRRGAKSLVFADGNPAARVLVLGEAPGRDEDVEGRPFVGRAGQLLDRMFAAIGMVRDHPDPARALYITNVMPWRPPQNRDPEPAEIAMMLPFVMRHIALVDPTVIVVMGNTPLQALLGQKGITRLRGIWAQALDRPVLPMFHPAYLLRQPIMKREAWADLLALQAKLREMP